MFRLNCFLLLKDIEGSSSFSDFDVKGPPASSYGQLWESGLAVDILKRKVYKIEGSVQSAKVKGIKESSRDPKYQNTMLIYLDVIV